jgi:hypothetical protein
MDSFLELILKVEIRPEIYIGNKDLKCFDCFLFGYRFAKQEKDIEYGNWWHDDFRAYLAAKYNDKRTLNVAGLIIENEKDGNSTDTFFRLLHEFLEKSIIGDAWYCRAVDKVISHSVCWEYCFAHNGGPQDIALALDEWIEESDTYSNIEDFHKVCDACVHCQWNR